MRLHGNLKPRKQLPGAGCSVVAGASHHLPQQALPGMILTEQPASHSLNIAEFPETADERRHHNFGIYRMAYWAEVSCRSVPGAAGGRRSRAARQRPGKAASLEKRLWTARAGSATPAAVPAAPPAAAARAHTACFIYHLDRGLCGQLWTQHATSRGFGSRKACSLERPGRGPAGG